MKPIIKIDRVSSLEEAAELQTLGADILTVSFDLDTRFRDTRKISKPVAYSIRECLVSTQLCCELSTIDEDTRLLVESCGFDWVQVSKMPPLSFRKQLQALNVGLIYSGIEASYEDDPTWILSSFNNETELGASYFQIDLLADIDNSWFFFKEECPKYPDELQIEDIEQIASRYPLVITLDYSNNNIIEIISRFQKVKGISFTLGTRPTRNDFHWFDYTQLRDILNQVNTVLPVIRSEPQIETVARIL